MPPRAASGFTLFEMVIAIAITGIIAAVVAVFIPAPVRGYFDTIRRADMANSADGALGGMTRELKSSLPGSVRIANAGDIWLLEFVPVTATGVYWHSSHGAATALAQEVTEVEVAGLSGVVRRGEYVVMGAEHASMAHSAIVDARPTTVKSIEGGTVHLTGPMRLPDITGNPRVYITGSPVSYVCNPKAGTLRRHWGYGTSQRQSTTFPTGASALLAQYVTACSFRYSRVATHPNASTLQATLTMTQGPSNITLYQEIQVNNEL